MTVNRQLTITTSSPSASGGFMGDMATGAPYRSSRSPPQRQSTAVLSHHNHHHHDVRRQQREISVSLSSTAFQSTHPFCPSLPSTASSSPSISLSMANISSADAQNDYPRGLTRMRLDLKKNSAAERKRRAPPSLSLQRTHMSAAERENEGGVVVHMEESFPSQPRSIMDSGAENGGGGSPVKRQMDNNDKDVNGTNAKRMEERQQRICNANHLKTNAATNLQMNRLSRKKLSLSSLRLEHPSHMTDQQMVEDKRKIPSFGDDCPSPMPVRSNNQDNRWSRTRDSHTAADIPPTPGSPPGDDTFRFPPALSIPRASTSTALDDAPPSPMPQMTIPLSPMSPFNAHGEPCSPTTPNRHMLEQNFSQFHIDAHKSQQWKQQEQQSHLGKSNHRGGSDNGNDNGDDDGSGDQVMLEEPGECKPRFRTLSRETSGEGYGEVRTKSNSARRSKKRERKHIKGVLSMTSFELFRKQDLLPHTCFTTAIQQNVFQALSVEQRSQLLKQQREFMELCDQVRRRSNRSLDASGSGLTSNRTATRPLDNRSDKKNVGRILDGCLQKRNLLISKNSTKTSGQTRKQQLMSIRTNTFFGRSNQRENSPSKMCS